MARVLEQLSSYGERLNMQQTIEHLKQLARDSWKGQTGEERAKHLEEFLDETLENYSSVLGYSKEEILNAMESRRDYSAINYYQRANFPLLQDVLVYQNREEFLKVCPSKEYICPMCEGISTDPNKCNTGLEMKKGEICNWKSYGLFGTMGKGASIVFKDSFLQDQTVYKIFMPKELANTV